MSMAHPFLNVRKRCISLAIATICIFLTGCVASTVIVRNDKLSKETNSKDFSSYKEILFLPPKEDPRKVVPKVVTGLETIGLKVTTIDPDKPIEASQGTGFVIAEGYLLTCAHVIGDEKAATITLEQKKYLADVIKSDKDEDLALVKLREKMPPTITPLSFRGLSHPYSMGEDVFTIGYPLSRILGDSARMTKGLLSATTGLRDDPKTVQVTAEVQPGNSGGPLLNQQGQIVGIVQQTMNPWRVAQATGGALPQNINFAEKNGPVLAFLNGVEGLPPLTFDKPAGLDKAASAVVKVQAGTVMEDDRKGKLVVRFEYFSIWDMWWRFRYFVLSAYDYENQEPLFAVGQGRDNMVSNEEVVINDTLTQFKKALSNH